jgi:glycerol-3-phosphate acyltransferase PlsX
MARPTILLDAMGGEHAPDAPVRAAAHLSLEAHLDLVVVGNEREISKRLGDLEHNPERIAVHHAPQVIEMGDNPEAALERKPHSSLEMATRLLAEGLGDALVTAGNTGALLLACSRHLPLLPGVTRPALGAVYPTQIRRGVKHDPFSLILDVGATLDVSADDLVAFAVMGSSYARVISRNPRPRVALLSNGTEPEQGLPAIVEAHRRLTRLAGIEFIGNIEGLDIPRGTADVVVTGGFVGNVVLKMLEGVAETVLDLARYAQKERVKWRAGLFMLSSGIDKIKQLTDWEQYGGAPLLGYVRPVIKAHRASREQALVNAGKVAAKAVASRFDESIRTGLPTGT